MYVSVRVVVHVCVCLCVCVCEFGLGFCLACCAEICAIAHMVAAASSVSFLCGSILLDLLCLFCLQLCRQFVQNDPRCLCMCLAPLPPPHSSCLYLFPTLYHSTLHLLAHTALVALIQLLGILQATE